MKDDLKISAIACIFSFVFGIALCYAFMDTVEKPMPPAFSVERGGKMVGYADTDPEFTEIVTLTGEGVKSKGVFIAFPIWGENHGRQT